MTSFSFSVDVSLPENMPSGREAFPALATVVEKLAAVAMAQWQGYAAGEALPDGRRIGSRTGAYLRSIQMRPTGDFSAEIFSELPYAHAIEEGTKARDLKKMLDSSVRVRVTKDGRRYLIIPFRWGTPETVGFQSTMTTDVHAWWQQEGRRYSAVLGQHLRLSGTGAFDITTRRPLMVPGWSYKWGDRLRKADLAALGATGNPAKRMEGMVNFRNPGGAGGGSHSQYLTFRTMVEGGKGWLAAARPGYWPARTVENMIKPIAEEALTKALQADVGRLLGA